MKIRIILAPIHYILDAKNSGSEFYWSYKIYEGISRLKLNKRIWFITGGTRGITNAHVIDCKLFSVEKLNLTLINIYKFYLHIYIQIRRLNRRFRKKIILHHVLPFNIYKSFNIYALLSNQRFIIGPVQSPLNVVDSDLDVRDARGFNKSDKKIIDFLNRIIFFILNPFLSFMSYRTLIKAEKIIAINKHTQVMLINRGVRRQNISIIPPGIDISKFKCKLFNKNLSVSIEFISVGYLLHRKGIDLLIQAMNKIKKKNKNVRLRIIGDGPQRENLETMVIDRGLKDYVVFHGFIPNSEIQSLYHKADVFVSMSRSESWGQMYIEAMACGLPIISSKNVGSNEIIQDGKFGFLVEQENVDDLVKKMEYFIENREKIEVFGRKARMEVEQKYDWDTIIIPKYEIIYQNLLK